MNRFPFLYIILILVMTVMCAIAEDLNEVRLKFSMSKNPTSNNSQYELVFFKDGKTIAKRVYENGKVVHSEGKIPDGVVMERYDNNKIKNIIMYENGKRNGPVLGFYKTGKLKVEATYSDDNPIGVGRRYYENGNLMAEWEIVDGKEIYHREYYEDGQLKEKYGK